MYFPILNSIKDDSNLVIQAINHRIEHLSNMKYPQGALQKIKYFTSNLLHFSVFGLSSIALPCSLYSFSLYPFLTAGGAFCLALTSLFISRISHHTLDHEFEIRSEWKKLFEALLYGTGSDILLAVESLQNCKKKFSQSFDRCVSSLASSDINIFFHKVCAVAFLMKSIESVHKGHHRLSSKNAYKSLIHFKTSGLPLKFQFLADKLVSQNKEVWQLIVKNQIGSRDIRSLDYLIFLMNNEKLL